MTTTDPNDLWREKQLPDGIRDEADESDELDPAAARLARIEDYRQQSLQRKDPLSACLGLQNAALMEISFRFETALQNNLQQASNADPSVDSRALTTYLAMARQIDRNTNLALRMDEPKGSGRRRSAGFVAMNEPLRPLARPR